MVTDSTLENSPITGAHIDATPRGWPDGYEQFAQDACLDALLDDLRELSHSRIVVLLFDQYERNANAFKDWLEGALMTRVFREDDPFGAILIVIASTEPVLPRVGREPRSPWRAAGALVRRLEQLDRRAHREVAPHRRCNQPWTRGSPPCATTSIAGSSLQDLEVLRSVIIGRQGAGA